MAKRPPRPSHDPSMFDVLRIVKGKSNKDATSGSFVAPSTIKMWRKGWQNGGTKRPQHCTLQAVLEANGFTYSIVKKGEKR